MSESVKIVEKKTVPSEATIIIGLPDVGLVGLIAMPYMISELNLEEITHMDSELLPPVVVLFADLGIYHRQGEFSSLRCQGRVHVTIDAEKMKISCKGGILEVRFPRKKRYKNKVE